MNETASLCEIREGIGLCDDCGKPKWPQQDLGYGIMVCMDCLSGRRLPARVDFCSLNSARDIIAAIMDQHYDIAACQCWICAHGRKCGISHRAGLPGTMLPAVEVEAL